MIPLNYLLIFAGLMRGVLHATVQKPWFRLPASSLLKADKQTIHNCWGFGEYAENKNNFSETTYKIGSECRYLWRVVSRVLNHKCPKKIRRTKRSANGTLHMCNMSQYAVSIILNVMQVTKLYKIGSKKCPKMYYLLRGPFVIKENDRSCDPQHPPLLWLWWTGTVRATP